MRLGRITTRTGDDGTTGLADGSRIAKDSDRIEAIGTVDELNSVIGLLLAASLPAALCGALTTVQHDLFDLGGDLATPGRAVIGERHVATLEQLQRNLNAALPALAEFVLPGGTPAAALCHVARSVCRRAERRLVGLLSRNEPASPWALQYLNRLSDLLFDMAREINHAQGIPETLWNNAGGIQHRD